MSKVIDATLRLVDKFTGPMNKAVNAMQKSYKQATRLGKQIEKTGKTFTSAGKTLTTHLTTPILALGAAAVKTAASFESEMSKVQAISGASGEDMEKLSKKAQEMGATTKYSASESAEAMQYMALAGWKTEEMCGGIAGIMNLAAASGEDLASTSDIVTDALTAFGLAAKDSGHFADVLAAASSNSNTTVAALGETYKYCAAIAGAMGYSVEDTTTAIGLMANSGIKASNAGTAMRKMMTQLQGVVEVQGKGIGKVAIACSNADGSMRSLNDILADCRKAFKGMTEEEKAANAEALVGKTAMSGFLAVMNANEKDINKLSGAINNCDGVSQSMADTMNNNLKGQLTLLKSQIEGIAISFGNKLTPYVKEAVTWCQKVADKFNNLSDSQQKMIIKIGLIVAAVGPALLIFGKLVTGVGKVVSIFGKVGKALKMAKSLFGLLTSPVGIVVGVLAALVAVGILVCKNWDKIKAAAKKVGNAIKSAFKASGASAEKFKSTFSKVKESIGKIVSNLAVIFGKIKEALSPIVSFVKKVFVDGFKVAFSAISGYFSGWITGISSVIDGAITAFQGITDFIAGIFTGNWKDAFNGLKTFFSGWGTAVVGIIKTPINGIIGLINGAIDGINSLGLSIPDWVPFIGGKEFKMNIPKIPMLYKGTDNWMGGLAITQDRGGEIMDLPKGTRVYPHDESIKTAYQDGKRNGNNGLSINVTKLADKIEVRQDSDIDKIVDKMAQKLLTILENGGAIA